MTLEAWEALKGAIKDVDKALNGKQMKVEEG